MVADRIRKKSLTNRIMPLVCLLFIVLIIGMVLNCAGLVYTKKEQREYANMAVKASMDSVDREISAFTREQAKMVIDYTQGKGALYLPLSQICSGDTAAALLGREQLNQVFSVYFFDYASKFHFFIYIPQKELYLPCDGMQDQKGIDREIADRVSDGTINDYAPESEWTIFSEEKQYLIKTMDYQDIYFGYWITAENFSALMKERISVGENKLLLTGMQGEPLTEHTELENLETGFFSKYIEVFRLFEKLPFGLRYYVPVSSIFQNLFWFQLILAAMMCILGGAFFAYFYYTTHHIIRPIQKFCDALADYTEGKPAELDSGEILELEKASAQFHKLTAQIKNLKISLYEKEVEQQKEVIEFMRLQIKPHFYLNCLNLACNMVELEKYEECKEMLRLTSDYFRYLLRSDMRKELICDELAYVKNYLAIQSIRYHYAFSYYIEQDEATMDCYIPPLIIQTFVENAIKNTVALDKPIDISVTVMEEARETQGVIEIFITDTGNGFDDQVLCSLQSRSFQKRKDGTGIGIYNSIKRLEYHFGKNYQIKFYNSPLGGAVVELTIPIFRKYRDKKKEE